MKYLIHFSGVLGIIFLIIGFIEITIEQNSSYLLVLLGIGSLLLLTLPLYLIERYRYNKHKKSIINAYKKEKKTQIEIENNKKSTVNYPSFRKQKSGLTWGGGSVHGSTAKRGSKRGFLHH